MLNSKNFFLKNNFMNSSNSNTKVIVWICGFSNSYFGAKFGYKSFRERSQWIVNLIEIFKKNRDIKLHVISPNYYNNKDVRFNEHSISYYLFKYRYNFLSKFLTFIRFNEITNYYLQRRKISKIIKSIKPDLLHWHGAENPIYSSSILDNFKSYNTILTIQGFINDDNLADNFFIRKRKDIEKKILSSVNNFGVRTNDMCQTILHYNQKPNFYWHNYPITKPNVRKNKKIIEKYDCASFARISPENGIEDFLKAIYIVKKSKNNIKSILIGPIDSGYKLQLDKLIEKLNIKKNVHFTGYFENQQLAFRELQNAKINVLCTYYDIIPGTILESMYIGVPVISYSVGGIPELNKERESIILVKKSNHNLIAKKILILLNDVSLRTKLINNSFITSKAYFDNETIYKNMLKIYKDILSSKN